MITNISCPAAGGEYLEGPLCEAPPEQSPSSECQTSSFTLKPARPQYDECSPRLASCPLAEPNFPASPSQAGVPSAQASLDPVSVLLFTANLWAYVPVNPKKDHYFLTPHLSQRLAQAAQVISGAMTEDGLTKIIALTEVWQKYSWDELLDQLNLSGFSVDEDQQIYFSDLGQGNNDLGLIVTDGAVIKKTVFKPFTWQGSARTECGRRLADEAHVMGIGLAVVSLPNGQDVCVEVNHPIHRRKEEINTTEYKAELSSERGWLQVEAELLRKSWGECEGLPLIRGGDFNMRAGQWEYDHVHAALNPGFVHSFDLLKDQNQAGRAPCSYCDGNRWGTGENEGVIDHFIGNAYVSLDAARLVDGSAYSDHNALLVSGKIYSQPQRVQVRPPATLLPDQDLAEMEDYFGQVGFMEPACLLLGPDNLSRKLAVLKQLGELRKLSPALTIGFAEGYN